MKYTILAFVFCISIALSAQTETQINNELQNRDITTQADVNAELAKRGMTESDARNMAKMYGIDYDAYIAKYILPSKSNTSDRLKTPVAKTTVTKISYVEDSNLTGKTDIIVAPKVDPKYFGYEIFQNNPFANKDYLVGNIDEGYILSPGDEIRIYVWGSSAYQAQVKIDLNGNIALPDNGVFFASGYTFKKLKQKLINYLGKSYGGLTASPSTAFLDVSLTQLRPVSVTVLGESNTPGPHLINGFATVLNALYASGGIKISGSLREIKVYRNNKLIKTVDLYDYITKGSLDKDMRLMNNDVIFIPSRFSSITLAGAVRKSAIFELKPTEGLNDLIAFSGGLLPTASLKDVIINRIIPFASRQKKEVYDKKITSVNLADLYAQNKNYTLYDGDTVTIKSILDRVINKVSISGSVKRPGSYPLLKYPNLSTLITVAADSLLPKTYMNKVDLYRVNADGSTHFKTFHLGEVLAGKVDIKLQNDDAVVVYNMDDIKNQELVTISGFVRDPKTMIWRENLSLYDVLFASTNLEELEYKSKILTSRVDVKRFNPQLGKFAIQTYDLSKIINRDTTVMLVPKDEVIVYSKDINKVIDEFISINGLVKKPGQYKLLDKMTVEDLILLAGGFTEYADKDTVKVSRPVYDVDQGELSKTYPVKINSNYLTGVIKDKAPNAFYLQHKDVLNVHQIAGYEAPKNIYILGEVRYPGSVALENKKESIDDILKKVGGLTPFASLKASYVERGGKPFIFDMDSDKTKKTNFLENGDRIVISSNSGTVAVVGAIANEGLFVWNEGKRLKSYLRKSGYRASKTDQVIIKGPNGITTRKKWLSNPVLLPNSTIYVYAKPPKVKNKNGDGMDKFIRLLSVITGALTTALLAKSL